MRSVLTIFSVLALPFAAHADTFNFTATGSAGGFNGSGQLVTSSNANGSDTITGISGSGITGLLGVNTFNNNDNLLFPSNSSLLDSRGFSFTDVMGNTAFNVNIAFVNSAYQVSFLDSDGVTATLPLTFTINATTPVVTPEPSGLVLLGSGALGLAGFVRRRFKQA